jgi:hypothetical protein
VCQSMNMVITEVCKDYPGFDRVLGEHRWKEFLTNPSEEDYVHKRKFPILGPLVTGALRSNINCTSGSLSV